MTPLLCQKILEMIEDVIINKVYFSAFLNVRPHFAASTQFAHARTIANKVQSNSH